MFFDVIVLALEIVVSVMKGNWVLLICVMIDNLCDIDSV